MADSPDCLLDYGLARECYVARPEVLPFGRLFAWDYQAIQRGMSAPLTLRDYSRNALFLANLAESIDSSRHRDDLDGYQHIIDTVEKTVVMTDPGAIVRFEKGLLHRFAFNRIGGIYMAALAAHMTHLTEHVPVLESAGDTYDAHRISDALCHPFFQDLANETTLLRYHGVDNLLRELLIEGRTRLVMPSPRQEAPGPSALRRSAPPP